MSWVTLIWSMCAGACLMLALMHLVVWGKDRTARANLVFSVMAIAVAVFAVLELALMRAENARTIRPGAALDACAGLGDHRVAGRVRAALSAGWAAVARVGRRRGSDVIADPQFRLLAEYQFSGDHCRAAHPFPRRIRLTRRGRSELVDAGCPVELAVAGDLRDGCRNYRLAPGRSAAAAVEHCFLRRRGDRGRGAYNLGNHLYAADGELVLSRHCRGDGL